jgi:hypothetical protein
VFVEDLVSVQALESLRRFYTDDGGYAVGYEVDFQLALELMRADWTIGTVTNRIVQDDSTVTGTVYEGDGTSWNGGAATDITDAGIRTYIKALDDVNAPMSGRVLVIPTIVKQDLLGLARFTEQAYVGEVGGANSIRNGLVGNIYGMEVYVTTVLPEVDNSAGSAQVQTGLCFQRDACVLVEQLGIRAQSQYKQEYLADLMTVDMIWGNKTVRNSSVINFVVPNS